MDTWYSDEVNMGNSWDQEEEVEIGIWNNSQQDNRPNDQNTWNYKHKGSYKVSRVHIFSKYKCPERPPNVLCNILRTFGAFSKCKSPKRSLDVAECS